MKHHQNIVFYVYIEYTYILWLDGIICFHYQKFMKCFEILRIMERKTKRKNKEKEKEKEKEKTCQVKKKMSEKFYQIFLLLI